MNIQMTEQIKLAAEAAFPFKSVENETNSAKQKGREGFEKGVEWAKENLNTHFHVADNSHGFQTWLDSKGIEYIPNGHFTAIPIYQKESPIPVDIFQLGIEFGLYREKHRK